MRKKLITALMAAAAVGFSAVAVAPTASADANFTYQVDALDWEWDMALQFSTQESVWNTEKVVLFTCSTDAIQPVKNQGVKQICENRKEVTFFDLILTKSNLVAPGGKKYDGTDAIDKGNIWHEGGITGLDLTQSLQWGTEYDEHGQLSNNNRFIYGELNRVKYDFYTVKFFPKQSGHDWLIESASKEVNAKVEAGTLCTPENSSGVNKDVIDVVDGSACVTTNAGDTTITGSDGDDTILVVTKSPKDTVTIKAGAGNDTIIVRGRGTVIVDAGDGSDVLLTGEETKTRAVGVEAGSYGGEN
ncbi:hypothetical protein N9F54_01710 [Actinomycetota bacterium]|nr:hypothetical protein [Actinomycetota bacterium]